MCGIGILGVCSQAKRRTLSVIGAVSESYDIRCALLIGRSIGKQCLRVKGFDRRHVFNDRMRALHIQRGGYRAEVIAEILFLRRKAGFRLNECDGYSAR